MLYVRSETHLPATGHRTPYRSSTDTAARTPLLGTFVRVRHTRVGHGLGKPLLFMGIRGSNEAHTPGYGNHVVGGGVHPQVVHFVGRTVRASKQLPIQFKKLCQTIRPFICKCVLDYRAL